MASLFEAFRTSVGADESRQNEADVALKFARFRHNTMTANGQKTQADPSIAMPVQNGRHAFSDQVLSAYSIAGEEADPELNTMLDELDALAISSQAISQMDTGLRQRYVNSGLVEFDPVRINERSAELQRMAMDRARPLLAENDALDRELKRINVGRMNEALSVDRLSAAAAQSDAKYKTLVQDMSYDQLSDAYSKGGINGVPKQWLANYMLEAGTLEAQNRNVKAALSSTGGGLNSLMSLGTGGVGQKAGTGTGTAALDFEKQAEAIAYNYTGDQLDTIITQHEERMRQSPPADRGAIVSVSLPGLNASVPLPVLLKARQQSTELANNGIKSGDIAKMNTLFAQMNNSAEVFVDSITQMGGNISTNSVAQSEVMKHYDIARGALKAGDISGAEVAIEAATKRSSEIIESLITTRPEAQQPFMREIQRFGRPNNPASVADYVSSLNSTVAMEQLPQNSPYRDAMQLIFSEMSTLDASAAAVTANPAFLGAQPSAKARQEALRDQLLDKASVSTYSRHFNAKVGERVLETGLRGAVLGRIAELSDPNAAMANDASASGQEIVVLTALSNTLFGANSKRGAISNTFRKQRAVTDDLDQPMMAADGQPLEYTGINVAEMIAAVTPFQTRLAEMGSNYQIFSAMENVIQQQSQALAGELLPNNDPNKQAVLYMVSGAYRANGEADANNIALGIVTQQLDLLSQAVTDAEARPVRVNEIINNSRGSVAETTLVTARAQEILSNFDANYDEKLGGIERSRLGSASSSNANQRQRAAQNQAYQELQKRQQQSSSLGTTQLSDERILEQLLGE